VLILRLKRCERALAGGRLDEAMKLLLPADARAHRRGQELLDRLVRDLVDRGRAHLAEGRLAAAEADWHAAASLAGNTPAVAQLRASLDQVGQERQRTSEARRRAKGTVEAFVRQGEFTLAHAAASQAPELDPVQSGAIVADVAATRAAVTRLADDVTAALARRDWEAAVHRLAAARPPLAAEPRVHQLRRDVAALVAHVAGGMIDAGRPDEAASALRRASTLGPGLAELESLRRDLDQCRLAWRHVQAARFPEAREILDRLAHARPAVRWIASASEELRRACGAIEAVRGSTLGMLEAGDETIALPATVAALANIPAAPQYGARPISPVAPVAAPRHPSVNRFLLHVDGAGSYLVLRGSTVEVGPVSASRPIDLPLIAAAGSPAITLSRCEEDYFLNAAQPVLVNDRRVSSKLLASGDRIAFGPRGRIEFRRPNAASGTALLRVGGARLPWAGVREVLLMDREIVMGASAAAHVRIAACLAPVILQATGDGGLLCRAEETVMIDGRPSGRAAAVRDGEQVVVGGASFVVRRD
jgi:tetratricopeptide (TPR) repeat protein